MLLHYLHIHLIYNYHALVQDPEEVSLTMPDLVEASDATLRRLSENKLRRISAEAERNSGGNGGGRQYKVSKDSIA